MKKIVLLIAVILLITLTGCFEQSEDKLIIGLNPGVDTIEVGDTFIDNGAHANYVFKTLYPTVESSDVNTDQVGVYSIIYEISYLEFSKTITRIVTVIDETPAVLTLNPGVDTVVIGHDWIDAGIQVEDNTNHDVSITVIGEVDINIAGEYLITYLVTDENGNASSIIRYVTIIELN